MSTDARATRRRWVLRVVVAGFYVAVAVMLAVLARKLDWDEIGASLRAFPARKIALAAFFSAACYAGYGAYEMLAAKFVGIRLRSGRVPLIGFAAYASSLSLGATLGAIGLRIRLYSHQGVDASRSSSIIAFNLLTNWSGYFLVLGLALLALGDPVPAHWPLQSMALRLIGIACLIVLTAYLHVCARHGSREWNWRKFHAKLPALKTAFAQVAISAPVWMLGAASLNALLPPQTGFVLVVVSLLSAAVAGLVVRIPAGLGVLEATVVAALGSAVGESKLLAALLVFRCIHYLVPLLLALLLVAASEVRFRLRGGKKIPAA